MKRLFLVLLIATALLPFVSGQGEVNVTGIVTFSGKYPLSKVSIKAQNSGATATTDSSGMFSLGVSEKDVLIASAAGFNDRKVKIGKQTHFKIDLTMSGSDSDFRRAVEAGHISDTKLSDALAEKSRRNARDYSKYNSIYELISSEIYNVKVTGNNVYLKQTRSMSAQQPVLFVVDDIIVSDISHINPTYVKSIEFIDDVGATIFGSKGANGVLKIYLK